LEKVYGDIMAMRFYDKETGEELTRDEALRKFQEEEIDKTSIYGFMKFMIFALLIIVLMSMCSVPIIVGH
jgi:hypothetical protein